MTGDLAGLAPEQLPLALYDLQRRLPIGAAVDLRLPVEGWARLPPEEVVARGGFAPLGWCDGVLRAERLDALPDTVGPAMRVLVVGINPSLLSAARGVGFARPGNRFWPAALAAGLVSADRDPAHALVGHGAGMTNLVSRPTRRADELESGELRTGAAGLERLVEWMQPRVVCMVGITGWRHAVDRAATPGLQPEPFGGRPVFVMHNPSGLNAHATVASLTEDLRTVRRLAGRP